jgi:hypothetical protein
MKRALNGKDKPVEQMLNLIQDADSVELKLTVLDSDHRSAIRALDMDVLDAELRQIMFFDTPDLKLNRAGVVLRARRMSKGADTTVKLRPLKVAAVSEDVRHSESFSVEVDAMPGAVVCSGSLKGKADNTEAKLVLEERRPIRKLFSPEQRAFFKKHAPKGLAFDSLEVFGPINGVRLKWTPSGFTRILAAELWFYPDGSRLLELSTKCEPDDAFKVLAETRIFLLKRGLTLTGKQATKTRKALEYFSREHRHK